MYKVGAKTVGLSLLVRRQHPPAPAPDSSHQPPARAQGGKKRDLELRELGHFALAMVENLTLPSNSYPSWANETSWSGSRGGLADFD
jgi:hypothetical protein